LGVCNLSNSATKTCHFATMPRGHLATGSAHGGALPVALP
jgi:hypothetical protein